LGKVRKRGEKMLYELAYVWETKKEADEHAKGLRKTKHGVRKHKTYAGIKVKRVKGGYGVYYKESKNYNKWLRTGK
jgi:hypothetical protein